MNRREALKNALLPCLLVLVAPAAQARFMSGDAYLLLGGLVELGVPDLRYEWEENDAGVALGFPVVLSLAQSSDWTSVRVRRTPPEKRGKARKGRNRRRKKAPEYYTALRERDDFWAVSLVVEPQYVPRDSAFRGAGLLKGVLGTDMMGVFVEGGGVLEAGNSGGLVGGGVLFGSGKKANVQIGYRHVVAERDRGVITFGAEIPLNFHRPVF